MCDIIRTPLVLFATDITFIYSATFNNIVYTPPSPILMTADNVSNGIESWFNSLGFGSIFTYFTRADPPLPPPFALFNITSKCTCFTFDSSKTNKIIFGTEDEKIDVNFTYLHCGSVDDTVKETLLCISKKLKSSFCGVCKCDDICNNPEALNVIKATMLMTELDLLDEDEVDYQDKMNAYIPILKLLCLC